MRDVLSYGPHLVHAPERPDPIRTDGRYRSPRNGPRLRVWPLASTFEGTMCLPGLENLGAAALELTPDDLRNIESAASQIPVKPLEHMVGR